MIAETITKAGTVRINQPQDLPMFRGKHNTIVQYSSKLLGL